MTVVCENAIIQLNKKIEVAFFKSISSDVTGTDEEGRKGQTPKEEMSCTSILGHTIKSRMTVICTTCFRKACSDGRMENCSIRNRWGAIKTISFVYHPTAHVCAGVFYV